MFNKNSIISSLVIMLLLSVSSTKLKAQNYKKIWQDAKKEANKDFESLYKAIASTESNKKQKQNLLKKCGLNPDKSSLGKSINFNLELSPSLSKLKDKIDDYEKAKKEDLLFGVSLGKKLNIILGNKKIKKEYIIFCSKEKSSENINFYLEANKKSGKYLYSTYVKSKSKQQINLPDDLIELWETSNDKKFKNSSYKGLVEKTKTEIANLMMTDTIGRFTTSKYYTKYQNRKKAKKAVANKIEAIKKIINKYEESIKKLRKKIDKGVKDLEGSDIDLSGIDFTKVLEKAFKKLNKKFKKLKKSEHM
ncbi:hypothetical protein [Candidatus Uabimicrobium sp. HlEnr_7]|uniref:hypothetical protein n=1 Tax=Candidatus Uabimicrobium helgolandensis TaxID=3095367 RepID=UPI0035567D65